MKTSFSTAQAPVPSGPYSQGIEANGFYFTAGQTAHDAVTDECVGETIEEQTERTLDNLAAVLAARGLDLGHLVKTTVHLKYPERDFDGFNRVYAARVPAPFPVRTTVGSVLGDFLVEIDGVAYLP
ncbi:MULTISPECIES: RidA family protein [Arthrobacter]|uniref:RidA family protein n=2 Tax=Arthrobacter TaxID=1663 RepID=A0ABU9KJG6_9MICC|nr:RidA family protein [Arthrobacter sp. YJM1]MDP5226715.1 RidA family protein [Arthrobacter sp. YJM1]